MKKINTLNSVILSKAKNLKTYAVDAYRSFTPFWMTKSCMTLAMVLAFACCSEEDLVQPTNGQAGTLHITSVSVDGQQVKSRAVADDGQQYGYDQAPYNQSLNGFGDGDVIELVYMYSSADDDPPRATATYNDGAWTIAPSIVPNADGESWNNLLITAHANGEKHLMGNEAGYADVAAQLGIVAATGMDAAKICLATDDLSASTTGGSIRIDTNPLSPTLGATTISFDHSYRALLRLPIPDGGFNVSGTYVVNGTAHQVTALATLWAVAQYDDGQGTGAVYYFPLTKVGSNLQSIVNLAYGNILIGFKAVLYTQESGQPTDANYDASKVLTLDLPFKVDNTASTGIDLEENKLYPLTLKISPQKSDVSLTIPGKPGWNVSEDDEELLTNDNYLAYNAADQYFEVNALAGLQLLSKWMTDEITTAQLKAYNFVGCSSIPTEAAALSANVRLMQDITLAAPEAGESNWTAIGTSENSPYTGVFDGNGHTITGMVINTTVANQGFVGYLGQGGQIKNLTFADAEVSSTAEGSWIGIVAGFINGATVENCYTAVGSSISGVKYVGGIVGGATNSTIAGCINAATVANTGGGDTAGVVGNTNNSIVIACGNTVAVNATGCSVGGIVGYTYGGMNIASWTIDTTEKDGFDGNDVSEKDGYGDLDGNLTITACYSVASESALNSKLDKMNEALWQYYKSISATTGLFWKESTSGWPTFVEQEVSGESNPYILDLAYVTSQSFNDQSGTFRVGNAKALMTLNKWMTNTSYSTDDFKATGFTGHENFSSNTSRLDVNITLTDDITLPTVAEGQSNWTSIINRSNNYGYQGIFDGAGHTIENLTICESGYAYVGLVGRLVGGNDRGRVRNLTLENVKITGNGNVGGIVGEMEGDSRVENCTVSGVITSKGRAGGIVAWAHGSNLLIYGCTNHAAINVNFTSDSPCPVGGIVGNLSSSANCVSCGNTGVITLDGRINYICVGGIVGLSEKAKLIGCWSIDNVEKESYTNSYAEGANKDGFGAYYDSTITGCYTAAARTEGTTEQKYINDNVNAMNSNISNFVLSNYVTTINYYWVADANGGWPTLTTEAPASPEQGN